jgi:hypothetical protein
MIYQVVFYNSKGTSADPLAPPSKRGSRPSCRPPPSSGIPEYYLHWTTTFEISFSGTVIQTLYHNSLLYYTAPVLGPHVWDLSFSGSLDTNHSSLLWNTTYSTVHYTPHLRYEMQHIPTKYLRLRSHGFLKSPKKLKWEYLNKKTSILIY